MSQKITRGGFPLSDDEPVPAGPAPALSEHTGKWLRQLGYGAEKIAELRKAAVI